MGAPRQPNASSVAHSLEILGVSFSPPLRLTFGLASVASALAEHKPRENANGRGNIPGDYAIPSIAGMMRS